MKGSAELSGVSVLLKRQALEIALESLRECAADRLVRAYLEKLQTTFEAPDFFRSSSKVFLIAAGKASLPMAAAAGEILGWHRVEGLIATRKRAGIEPHGLPLQVIEAGHPLPDAKSLLAGNKALEELKRLKPGVPVLFLISGGASALFEALPDGISLKCLRSLTESLLRSGIPIEEINAVRVALSNVKGGRLLEAAGDRECLTLILSDVVGDRLEAIGSGPTVPRCDNLSEKAIEVLKRVDLWETLDRALKAFLETKAATWSGASSFPKAKIELVGNNRILCETAIRKLKALGFNTLFLGSTLSGEAKETGRLMADLAKEIILSGNPVASPAAIVSGGETVVTLGRTPSGVGGPNQEVALSFAIEAEGLSDAVLLSIDTDGYDGTSAYAGGIADGKTFARISKSGIHPRKELEEHNATIALESGGGLVDTGDTNNNLNDFRVLLVGAPALCNDGKEWKC